MKIYVLSKSSKESEFVFLNEGMQQITDANLIGVVNYELGLYDNYINFLVWLSNTYGQLEFFFVTIDTTHSERWDSFSISIIVEENINDLTFMLANITSVESTIFL